MSQITPGSDERATDRYVLSSMENADRHLQAEWTSTTWTFPEAFKVMAAIAADTKIADCIRSYAPASIFTTCSASKPVAGVGGGEAPRYELSLVERERQASAAALKRTSTHGPAAGDGSDHAHRPADGR